MFLNNKLKIIDDNCNFQHRRQEKFSRIAFNEEVKQEIVSNEEIASTDASIKDRNIAGV